MNIATVLHPRRTFGRAFGARTQSVHAQSCKATPRAFGALVRRTICRYRRFASEYRRYDAAEHLWCVAPLALWYFGPLRLRFASITRIKNELISRSRSLNRRIAVDSRRTFGAQSCKATPTATQSVYDAW